MHPFRKNKMKKKKKKKTDLGCLALSHLITGCSLVSIMVSELPRNPSGSKKKTKCGGLVTLQPWLVLGIKHVIPFQRLLLDWHYILWRKEKHRWWKSLEMLVWQKIWQAINYLNCFLPPEFSCSRPLPEDLGIAHLSPSFTCQPGVIKAELGGSYFTCNILGHV